MPAIRLRIVLVLVARVRIRSASYRQIEEQLLRLAGRLDLLKQEEK